MIRTVYKSKSFEEFYASLNKRTIKKVEYILQIVQDEYIVSSKFVKNIVNSDFYELKISTDNEYRVMTFTMDSDSFINSTKVLLLNGFIKKSESDYAKQIRIAKNILIKENYLYGNNDND